MRKICSDNRAQLRPQAIKAAPRTLLAASPFEGSWTDQTDVSTARWQASNWVFGLEHFPVDVFDSANETRWGGVIGTGIAFGSRGVSAGIPAGSVSAPIRSVRTLILSLHASITASVLRSSRSTDLVNNEVS